IVELAILKATDGYIYPEHLPDSVFQRKSIPQTVQVERRKGVNASNPSATDPSASTSPRQVLGMEVEKVLSKLQQCRGSRRSAASELGISERKLYRIIKRCEELGLVVPKPYQ
ncbi:MAG: helix-turn-helix domain-containing protein, partial [Gammaproteobacteria bacterium]